MNIRYRLYLVLITGMFLSVVNGETGQHKGELHYLGNEGVMFTSGETKVLFDPFFNNDYGQYALVPEEIRHAIFNGKAPYDKISALFISHAHGDHFSSKDVLKFISVHKNVKVFAPQQAIELLLKEPDASQFSDQLKGIKLNNGKSSKSISLSNIAVDAIRIPHAGWPSRAAVENIVFTVTIDKNVSVVHLGDADANEKHFDDHVELFHDHETDVALPPYWFFESKKGNAILENSINAKVNIGIHVPTNVPVSLKDTGKDYFSKPGETRIIKD